MLWYAVEKLFMQNIGFNTAQIALTGIIISITMVALQVPTGILADRWSRKGTLMLGSGALAINALVGLLSHSVFPYLLYASILWGIFAAIRSGTFDAVVYDVLQEETGNGDGFEHYFGRLQAYSATAFVAAALLSGVVGKYLSVRATFWVSMPFIALSFLAILRFKEPTIHKAHAAIPLIKHTKQTLISVIQSKYVGWIVLATILFGVSSRILYNLSPVWYLAFGLPVFWYGPAYALINVSPGIAGHVAKFFAERDKKVVILAVFIALISFVLAARTSVIAIVVAQTIILTGCEILLILLSRKLHDVLPSHVRTGSSSTVGTFTQLVVIPFTYLFGQLSNSSSVFHAAWVVVAVTIAAVFIFCFKVLPSKQLPSH
jgi:MFS family permease